MKKIIVFLLLILVSVFSVIAVEDLLAQYHMAGISHCFSTTGGELTESGTLPNVTGLLHDARGTYSGTNYCANATKAIFDYTQPHTISCWIRPTTATPSQNQHVLFQASNWGVSGTFMPVIKWTSDDPDGWSYELNKAGTGTDKVKSASGTLNTSHWHHFVAVFNGTMMHMFIDGVIEQTLTDSYSQGSTTPSVGWYMGVRIDYTPESADEFEIDECQIYSRNISNDEIAILYNNGVGTENYLGQPVLPTISNEYDVSGSGTNKTDDTTPAVNCTTADNGNCYTSKDNSTWTIMGTTGTTNHQGTLATPFLRGYPNNLSIKCNNSAGADYTHIVYNITQLCLVNLYLDGLNSSRKYEFGSSVNLTANLTRNVTGELCYDESVCIDLDAPGYGTNYTCGNSSTDFIYNITILRQSSFSEGSNITLFGSGYCYQEFANVSTSCGGLDTGDYSNGCSNPSDNCQLSYDGNYATFYQDTDLVDDIMYFNYTKPDKSTIRSLWQTKDTVGTRNTTIPLICFNQLVLQLRVLADPDSLTTWGCYNSTEYINVFTGDGLVYEEAMFWHFDPVINFTMDNRTDLIEGSINISGSVSGGLYPSNITIRNEDVTIAILPGTLNETNLTQINFVYSGTSYTTKNISFISASTEVINVNRSGSGDIFYNLTFQIYGSNVDKGNDVNYNDTFTNESIYHLNGNTSVFGYYDNFENNYTTVWEFSISESGGHDNQITTDNVDDYLWVRSTYSSASCSVTTGWSEADNSGDTNFDLRNITQLDYTWRLYSYSIRSGGSGSQTTSSFLYVTDGTNSVSLYGITRTGWSYQVTDNQNISLRKQSDDSWNVYINEVYDSNKVLSSLNPGSQWYLRLRSTSGTAPCTEGDTQTADSDARVYHIKRNGLTLNKTATNVSFETNHSFITSSIVANTSITSNYTAVWLIGHEYKPSGTNIYYYASADNGTTWLSITPNERNVYLTQGNQIIYRVNLTSNNINLTPILYDLNVKVVPSAITGIEIDGGSDGVTDWNISFELNSTTSPQNVTISSDELLTYSGDYGSQESFLFPISISTGSSGTLQIDNLKSIQNPNPVILNVSVLEDCTFCEISVSITNGIINITNLAIDLLGSWNYTALAHLSDYSINDSHKVIVKYSKFNCTYPMEIDYFEPFPVMSRDDKNVTPYGQEINYCNTSSDLYCESTSIPIFNCTYLGYDEPLINLTVYLNQSQNGIDIWLNNSLTKTGSVNVTNLTKKPIVQLNLTHSKGIFGWVDFWNASLTDIYNFDPNITFESYCSGCLH